MNPLLSYLFRQLRYNAIRPYLSGAVLDLGCSYGDAVRLLRPGQSYVGVDYLDLTSWWQTHRPQYPFYQRDFNNARLELPGRFDTILMLATLEHLQTPENVLCQLPTYLNPGGQVVMTTPSPLGHRVHRLGARLGLFYREAADEHHTIFTRGSLAVLLESSGLRVTHARVFELGGNLLFVCQAKGLE